MGGRKKNNNYSSLVDDPLWYRDAYLLEKAASELRYELHHRLDWAHIPIQGILQLLDEASA